MYCVGGLAEYCVMPAHVMSILPNSLPYMSILPNSLPYTGSTILGCAVFTSFGAMAHTAEVHLKDSVAVIGIGGASSR